jgi:hypothetical protein
VLNPVSRVLDRLRQTLFERATQAYTDRDAKGATDHARSFAAGEAHAYGMADRDVKAAQGEREDEE